MFQAGRTRSEISLVEEEMRDEDKILVTRRTEEQVYLFLLSVSLSVYM